MTNKTKEQRQEERQLKLIDKASDVWNNSLSNITPLPDPNKDGLVTLTNTHLRQLLDERGKLRWASGVFETFAAFTTNH